LEKGFLLAVSCGGICSLLPSLFSISFPSLLLLLPLLISVAAVTIKEADGMGEKTFVGKFSPKKRKLISHLSDSLFG
jgi:hypothetical protein